MHRFRVVSKSWNLPIENGLKLNLENKSCENRRIRSLKGKIIKNQCEKVIGRGSIVLQVLKKYHATFSGFLSDFLFFVRRTQCPPAPKVRKRSACSI